MSDSEERLHVWDFDPLTKKEFVKLMYDAAHDLETSQICFPDIDLGNVKKMQEIARRVQYSGEAYREDPSAYYSKHAKPIERWECGIPKIQRDIVEKCLDSITALVTPIIDEMEGLLISKRWHKIPDSDSELAILAEERDSYLFVSDLIWPLFKGLCEFESLCFREKREGFE